MTSYNQDPHDTEWTDAHHMVGVPRTLRAYTNVNAAYGWFKHKYPNATPAELARPKVFVDTTQCPTRTKPRYNKPLGLHQSSGDYCMHTDRWLTFEDRSH